MNMREQGKIVVVQFFSVLSRASSLQSRFLIALVPSWRIVKGVTMTQMYKVIAWFWTWLLEGKFPLTEFYTQE